MIKTKYNPQNIDEYIAKSPEGVQNILTQIRETIKKAAPDAKEVISYRMPAFKMNGILVWFAAFNNHIGFFPKVSAMKNFEKELTKYETSKGTIRFPFDKKIPLELISKITKFRVKEELEKHKLKVKE